MKITKKVRIKNDLGLHARPATVIVKLLQSRKAAVTFTYGKETINARSIMSVLMLAARRNTQITIIAEGEDAEQTVLMLEEAFANKFGE